MQGEERGLRRGDATQREVGHWVWRQRDADGYEGSGIPSGFRGWRKGVGSGMEDSGECAGSASTGSGWGVWVCQRVCVEGHCV